MATYQTVYVKQSHTKWLLTIAGAALGVLALLVYAHLKPLTDRSLNSTPRPNEPSGAYFPRDCNSAATCTPPPDAFLKVNQFYVLFTYPIVPHLDKSGTFLVGLNAFAEMIGATVRTDRPTRSETITWRSNSVTFIDRARTAAIDGRYVPIPVPALFDQPSGKMIAPLSVILQAFHIRPRWNAKYRILALQDKSFFPVFTADPDILGPIWMQEGPDFKYPDKGYLVPTAERWLPRPGDVERRDLELTVGNVKSRTLQRDQAFINFVQADFGVGGHQELQYSAGGTLNGPPDEPRIHQPPLKNGQTRTAVNPGVGVLRQPYSLCILAWLNTRG